MKKKIRMVFLSTVILISSCAVPNSTEKEKVKRVKDEEFADEFNLSSEERLKFKIYGREPVRNQEANTLTQQKITVRIPILVSSKDKRKGKTASSQIVKRSEKKTAQIPSSGQTVKKVEIVIEQKKEDLYPEDYPKNLVEMDKYSAAIWQNNKRFIFSGEVLRFDISYIGIPIGEMSMKVFEPVNIDGRVAYHFSSELKSSRYYSYIYSLDDTVTTYVDSETFTPIKYSLFQIETNKKVDDLQFFSNRKLKTYFLYKRIKKGAVKKVKKSAYIPKYFQDALSSMYFVRGLDFKTGKTFSFPIVNKAKIKMLKLKVIGEDRVKVNGKRYDAWRLTGSTIFPAVIKSVDYKANDEEVNGKGDNIVFWISKDKWRKLLKFRAKVKIGSIYGELK